jgi:hypothetical protein
MILFSNYRCNFSLTLSVQQSFDFNNLAGNMVAEKNFNLDFQAAAVGNNVSLALFDSM